MSRLDTYIYLYQPEFLSSSTTMTPPFLSRPFSTTLRQRIDDISFYFHTECHRHNPLREYQLFPPEPASFPNPPPNTPFSFFAEQPSCHHRMIGGGSSPLPSDQLPSKLEVKSKDRDDDTSNIHLSILESLPEEEEEPEPVRKLKHWDDTTSSLVSYPRLRLPPEPVVKDWDDVSPDVSDQCWSLLPSEYPCDDDVNSCINHKDDESESSSEEGKSPDVDQEEEEEPSCTNDTDMLDLEYMMERYRRAQNLLMKFAWFIWWEAVFPPFLVPNSFV